MESVKELTLDMFKYLIFVQQLTVRWKIKERIYDKIPRYFSGGLGGVQKLKQHSKLKRMWCLILGQKEKYFLQTKSPLTKN